MVPIPKVASVLILIQSSQIGEWKEMGLFLSHLGANSPSLAWVCPLLPPHHPEFCLDLPEKGAGESPSGVKISLLDGSLSPPAAATVPLHTRQEQCF